MKFIYLNDDSFMTNWKKIGDNRIEATLYSELNIQYSIEYADKSSFKDCSMILICNENPILGCIFAVETTSERKIIFGGYGRPICYIESEKSEENVLKRARKLFKKKFMEVCEVSKPNIINYNDYLVNGNLSFLGNCLMDMGAVAVPYFSQIIELSKPKEVLWQQIRKSYKSLINWGNNNLKLRLISKHINIDDMETFRKLHHKVAGFSTRSVDTWKIQYKIVKNEDAFIIFGYLENELVTAAYFVCNKICCYYGVGASIRELFDRPLSHAVLWNAILYSKKIGNLYFEIGEQLFSNQSMPTKKELNICKFKKGFGGTTKVRLRIKWENDPKPDN